MVDSPSAPRRVTDVVFFCLLFDFFPEDSLSEEELFLRRRELPDLLFALEELSDKVRWVSVVNLLLKDPLTLALPSFET